ncbi:hypothetical protein PSHT_08628 [Puccinia striiformis]|uniref:Uncharacterized protein n=1 Tax=Puccinia striiformis TaxID=27350 RepID=A0A2S4VN78_9BASI|nr:hypothetical protein PSHT_08628 [Puccinia striiformis]
MRKYGQVSSFASDAKRRAEDQYSGSIILQHYAKPAAASDPGKAIISSIQHPVQHGASGVPTIPNKPRVTESYLFRRELLSGIDWELPNFAAPELHCQPKHPHEDNPGFPLGPLSVDDYEIEDWPLPAHNGPMGDASGDPVITTETKYSLCHQELLRNFDWELPDIWTQESHHHQKPPQHIVELSSSSGVKDHNIQAFLLPEEIEEMKNTNPCVKSPSKKTITKFPSVTHKSKPELPGNPELIIKNQLQRGQHKQLPRIQDLNEHQSKNGVPSSPRGIAGHGTIHLMNPDGAISLAQHRMMLVDILKFDESVFIINQDSSPVDLEKIALILSFIQTHCGNFKRLEIPKMQPEYFHLVFDTLILSHQYSPKSMDLPSTTNKIKESPIKHKQRYWKDRTGIDLTRMHFHGHLQRSVSAKKAFTLVSFYLDMIGTILQNYHDAYSDGSTSDIGSIMIKKAWEVCSQLTADEFLNYRFESKSSAHGTPSSFTRLQLCWNWIAALITGKNMLIGLFLPLPRMQSAEPKIDTPVQPYLQHHEKQAAAFDTGKAIMSSNQHSGQHGASRVPTIPNNPRVTESYPFHRELLSGLDWELPNFAAPELHCQPKHPHEDNPGSPLEPLSVDDYEIEDWPLPAQDGPMSEDSGEPVMTTGTKYTLCHQELVRSFDWELPNILAHESHHHQKPPQPIMDLSSSPSLKNHNSEALLLPEEIGEMMNSQSWSDSPDLSPLQMEMPEIPIQHPLEDCGTVSQNLLKHPLEPFDESLLALGGHIPARASKRLQISPPSANLHVESPSKKTNPNLPSVTHKSEQKFPGIPGSRIKTNLKELPRIQDLNEHQSKNGVPSSHRGIVGHGAIHLMNPNVFCINQDTSLVDQERIALILSFIQTHCRNVKRLEIPKVQPNYFHMIFDKLILSHQILQKCKISPSRTNNVTRDLESNKHKKMLDDSSNTFYKNSDLWFRYWKERTGIDLIRIHFDGHRKRSLQARKTFTLLLFYLDMIGTILRNYSDVCTGGHNSDSGAIMIKKAWEVCSQLSANNFLDYRFGSISPAPRTLRSLPILQLCWNWIAALITGLENKNFANIFFYTGKTYVDRIVQIGFNNIFCYSFQTLTKKLLVLYQKIDSVKV